MFSAVSGAAARAYYRCTVSGARVPSRGSALLVANHPNSLIDPMMVVAAAGRPVRFLAKAPLFADAKVGWLVRASGSIPVYRRVDDPTATDGNVDMFHAVIGALAAGDAVGIFPEGVSHSDPNLAPLKTGAARIALGAAAEGGTPIPIVPVGLVFREKNVFRSEAHIVVGSAVAWDDLHGCPPTDRDAVRALTDRIDGALRKVTVNLERWEDGPLVECVERIWHAERGGETNEAARVGRVESITRALRAARETDEDTDLLADLGRHCRRLHRLGLRPRDLGADVGLGTALRWAVRRSHLVVVSSLAMAGLLVYWIPYKLTGIVAAAGRPDPDQESTHKLLAGIVTYLAWIVALVGAATWWRGWAGLVTLVALPVIGWLTLWSRDRWRSAFGDARRFLRLRSRADLVSTLAHSQRELVGRLDTARTRINPATPNTRTRQPNGDVYS